MRSSSFAGESVPNGVCWCQWAQLSHASS